MSIRIKGADGSPPIEGPDSPGLIDETEAAQAPDEVAAAEVTDVAAVGAVAADAIANVAGRLKAGQITVDQAVELLIDDAIERQVGRAIAAARALEPELREALRSYAAADPFLAARIRRLTSK